ncbi:MAG: methyltransferase domain-containing protein [Halobacteria archaeon]|nr:methyltransferase domain-containing protein [Halobacteria archaeon]
MTERDEILDTVCYTAKAHDFTTEEIDNYLSFDADPDEVREVISDNVYDVSVGETDEGVFTRVEGDGIQAGFDSGMTDWVESSVVEILEEETESGSERQLLRYIDSLRGSYPGSGVEYTAEDCLAYLTYHFPAYYVEAKHVLSDLPLSDRMRVLDVGAGVGANALGLHDLLPSRTAVEYTGVEPSGASEYLERLLSGTRTTFGTRVERGTASSFSPEADERYDLILFFNVVNELNDPVGVLEEYTDYLSEDGSLVVVDPADLETSVPLREIQREFHDEYTVYGPCTYLWDEKCGGRCWSFDSVGFEPPDFARSYVGDRDAYVRSEVKYSHFILRKDGRTRRSYDARRSDEAMMDEMSGHVGRRIRVTAEKMSGDLSDKNDGTEIYKICDGSAKSEHYAVLRQETEFNTYLRDADYGEILRLEDVLVHYNPNESEDVPESYHLVVDSDSVVARQE